MVENENFKAVLHDAVYEHRDELRDILSLKPEYDDNMDRMRAWAKEVNSKFNELATTAMSRVDEKVEQSLLSMEQDIEKRLDAIKKAMVKTLVIKTEIGKVEVEGQHFMFDDVYADAALGLHQILVGPTQAGKSYMVEHVAKALNREYTYVAFGPTQDESVLQGYQNAQGFYVPTEFYYAVRDGKVMLFDEMDLVNPSVLPWANNGLSNGTFVFPRTMPALLAEQGDTDAANDLVASGGLVEVHPNFIVIGSANTYGDGGDMRYVGRQPIDASTKARFVIKHFPYDTSLEMQFSGNNEKLCNLVWALRKSIEDLGLRQVLSPSHTKRAATMLAAERDPVRVINVAILGDDTDKATRTKIVNNQISTRLSGPAAACAAAWTAC